MVQDIRRGRVTRACYATLLRNLLPAYRAMERGLDSHRAACGVRLVARSAVYRSRAIEEDLDTLCPDWNRMLPLLSAGRRYERRASMAAQGDGSRLLAHAYVRYLGDLSGGQILGRLLAGALGLGRGALSFHEFPEIADLPAFKAAYREAFDRAGSEIPDVRCVLDEAATVFLLNIEVSEAVRANRLGMSVAAR